MALKVGDLPDVHSGYLALLVTCGLREAKAKAGRIPMNITYG